MVEVKITGIDLKEGNMSVEYGVFDRRLLMPAYVWIEFEIKKKINEMDDSEIAELINRIVEQRERIRSVVERILSLVEK